MQRVGEANADLQVFRAIRARRARAIVVGGFAPAEGRARSTGGVHPLEGVGKPPIQIWRQRSKCEIWKPDRCKGLNKRIQVKATRPQGYSDKFVIDHERHAINLSAQQTLALASEFRAQRDEGYGARPCLGQADRAPARGDVDYNAERGSSFTVTLPASQLNGRATCSGIPSNATAILRVGFAVMPAQILLRARLDGGTAMWPRPDKSNLSNLGR